MKKSSSTSSGLERCQYFVDGVLDGSILAPKTVFLACERFQRDLERDDIYLDVKAANGAVKNVERFKHVKTKPWRGKPLILEPWQCFVVVNVFGWKWTKNKLRRFRYVYKQVPRKNGKSILAVCIALLMLTADREDGAEVYLGATSRDDAKDLLFNPAKEIVRTCPAFQRNYGLDLTASRLIAPSTFSQLSFVIGTPSDGANPHCAIVDEYHLHDDASQFNVFDSGMGAREQPLLMVTTTAGYTVGGVCHEMHDECLRILDGTFQADSQFVLIYEPDKEDSWDDPAVVKKVNPNYGVSVRADYLLDKLERAKRSAEYQTDYRTKHLNEWVGARTAWMNMIAWHRCKADISLKDYEGEDCYVAVDLATEHDIAAVAIVFPDGDDVAVFGQYYVPEGTVRSNQKYRQLVNAGWLNETPGNSISFSRIERDLIGDEGESLGIVAPLGERFHIKQLAYDPYQGHYLASRIEEHTEIDVIKFGQNVKNMSAPMKRLKSLVDDRRLKHEGDHALNWMMGNVMARKDEKDNIFPCKSSKDSPAKIDGAVATIMALALAIAEDDDGTYLNESGLVAL